MINFQMKNRPNLFSHSSPTFSEFFLAFVFAPITFVAYSKHFFNFGFFSTAVEVAIADEEVEGRDMDMDFDIEGDGIVDWDRLDDIDEAQDILDIEDSIELGTDKVANFVQEADYILAPFFHSNRFYWAASTTGRNQDNLLQPLPYNRYRNPLNMDFNKPIPQFLNTDEDNFVIVNALTHRSAVKNIQGLSLLHEIVDSFGTLSCNAQNLSIPITSMRKITGTNQRLYFKVQDSKVLGFIKIGEKNLFHRNMKGEISQLQPICVLDFYVHKSVQRNGVGKEIFQKFLKAQQKQPKMLAYDRPSHKFLSFLKKHYNLHKYVPQNNNFVIFDDYFHSKSTHNIVITDSLSSLKNEVIRNGNRDRKTDHLNASSFNKTKNFQQMWEKQKETYGNRRYSAPWAPWGTFDAVNIRYGKRRVFQ